ncbi:hypothetical protein DB88DRAFT_496863 [Papiliotrema laurentii]|uniref:Post-SET domain-containing protein n=1 Tax=Papiliotrema laurentii TaxID=5418 RepID=A0AAD9CX08_PAPLA|nr:hypothetical protein DB88DRAFT_496863 [Papiliotrema laurentii]
MPAAIPFLPIDPPERWVKPTLANTHNGKTYQPTHPDLFRVVFSAIPPGENTGGEEQFSSALIAVKVSLFSRSLPPSPPPLSLTRFLALGAGSLESGSRGCSLSFTLTLSFFFVQDFAPNETITPLTNLSQAPAKAYSSVQYGPKAHEHFELNSDLLFMNHSCSPSVYMSLPRGRPDQWAIVAGEKGLKAGEPVTFFYPSTEWDMAQGFTCSCGSDQCLGEINGAKYLTLEQLEQRGLVNDHIRALKEGEEKAE